MKVSRYLEETAWVAQGQSRPRSGLAVGAAVLATTGEVYAGCNIELAFRLGMHAEVNAIGHMLTDDPNARVETVLIVTTVEGFTPCGGCLDWITQLATPDALVVTQSSAGNADLKGLTVPVRDLMPWYPTRR